MTPRRSAVPAGGSSRRPAPGGAALVLLVLAVAVGGCSAPVAPPTPVPSSDAPNRVRVHGEPVAIAVEAHDAWVATTGPSAGLLVEIASPSLRTAATLRIGGRPRGVAVGFGSVWVANGASDLRARGVRAEDSVWRIDPKGARVAAKLHVAQPSGLAVGGGSLWVATDAPSVIRIDPTNDRVVAHVALPGGPPAAIAYGNGAVWTVTRLVRAGVQPRIVLSRIDARSGARRSRSFAGSSDGGSVLIAAGSFWLATGEGLRQIDPTTLRPIGNVVRLRVGNGVARGNTLWLTASKGRVLEFDTATRRIRRPSLRVGRSADQVATGAGAVWVTDSVSRMIARLEP